MFCEKGTSHSAKPEILPEQTAKQVRHCAYTFLL